MSLRLDVWLVQHGIFGGRDTAKRHIEAGDITVNGHPVRKASTLIGDKDIVCCNAREQYVGRGGYKLEKAIACAGLTLRDHVALDVGASTGGFTDCMRQHGARLVYAVDVGSGQLHPSLRADTGVVCLENTDIRSKEMPTLLAETPTFCSVDVSFISLTQVLPAVLSLVHPAATLVCLIKPQFEAGRESIGKNGVVKDPKVHVMVLRKMMVFFGEVNCGVHTLTYSPIRGGEGNVEYLVVLQRGKTGNCWDIPAIVNEAYNNL